MQRVGRSVGRELHPGLAQWSANCRAPHRFEIEHRAALAHDARSVARREPAIDQEHERILGPYVGLFDSQSDAQLRAIREALRARQGPGSLHDLDGPAVSPLQLAIRLDRSQSASASLARNADGRPSAACGFATGSDPLAASAARLLRPDVPIRNPSRTGRRHLEGLLAFRQGDRFAERLHSGNLRAAGAFRRSGSRALVLDHGRCRGSVRPRPLPPNDPLPGRLGPGRSVQIRRDADPHVRPAATGNRRGPGSPGRPVGRRSGVCREASGAETPGRAGAGQPARGDR